MWAALPRQYPQSLPRLVSSFSYICNSRTCYLQLPRQNVLQQRPMIYLTLKRITTPATSNPFIIRFNHPKLFCAINISNNNNSSLKDTMADNSQSGSGNSTILHGKRDEEKKLEKSTPRHIPPPPEKPLPDDCCGSGCVRCVWDIYYEELEEYNKLYKTSPHSSNISASGASSKQS